MSKTVASKQGYLDLVRISVQAVTGLELNVGCFTEKEIGNVSPAEEEKNSSGIEKLEALAKEHNIIEILE